MHLTVVHIIHSTDIKVDDKTIFGRNTILNFKVKANWETIHIHILRSALFNNICENKERKQFPYLGGTIVIPTTLKYDIPKNRKICDYLTEGPYETTYMYNKGTV